MSLALVHNDRRGSRHEIERGACRRRLQQDETYKMVAIETLRVCRRVENADG
jgi:hypothetical protein